MLPVELFLKLICIISFSQLKSEASLHPVSGDVRCHALADKTICRQKKCLSVPELLLEFIKLDIYIYNIFIYFFFQLAIQSC